MKVRIEIEARDESGLELRNKILDFIRKLNRLNRMKGDEKVEYEIALKTHQIRSVGFKED